MVYRIYVEKKNEFAHEAGSLLSDIKNFLGIKNVEKVRLINRYDVENIDETLFEQCINTVFSEPQLDNTSKTLTNDGANAVFAVEFLPGQFDQRADSASQCIQIISQGDRPLVKTAKVYLVYGNVSESELAEIKKYVINPVESREASLEEVKTLVTEYDVPTSVETLVGFTKLSESELDAFVKNYGLAMDLDDIKFCQSYFISEDRDPTITEIRMIDTYWSDHCRHTTFPLLLTLLSLKMKYFRRRMIDILPPVRSLTEQSLRTLWISVLLLQNILRLQASFPSLMSPKKSMLVP